MQFSMAHFAETCVNGTLRLECDNALMIATHTKPSLSKVLHSCIVGCPLVAIATRTYTVARLFALGLL